MATHDKVKILMIDIITAYLWWESILKQYSVSEKNTLNELKVYLTHLYEGTMVNLLENLSFHLTTLESLDEYLLDLLYYIYENLVLLIKNGIKEEGN